METLTSGAFLQNGTYRIERVLGQGGFGITYLATDINLQRHVAIKEFFPKDYCDRDDTTSHVTLGTKNTAEFVKRLKIKFLKEARNIAKFNHPGIIRIHSAFEENNTAYYVMEYIEGESLSAMVKQNGPLSETKALDYIRKVGDALEYVHARRINHLDVKPANIMVRKSDNAPILIDFGLSKQYDSEGHQTSTTPTGISHGYAPMEQYNDGGVKDFSPQTDVYSLAATLYYLLSGIVPPQATRLVAEELSFPNIIPADLIPAISKGMSPVPKNRQETVGRFLEDIGSDAPTEIGQTQRVESTFHPAAETTETKQKDSYEDYLEQESTSRKKWYIAAAVAAAAILLLVIIPKGEDTEVASSVDPIEKVEGIYYKSSLGACSYTGEVDSDGKPHGEGYAEWESGVGQRYSGQWVHGEMDGDSFYESRKGYTFNGKFKAGHYSEGTLTAPDGSYYVGTFDENGDKWTGTEYDANGNATDTWENGE